MSAGALSFTLASGTSFPDGSVGPFIVTIDQGLSTEEKVLVQSRSGAAFTVAVNGRGYNGTTPAAHSANAVVLHTIDAQDLDEANNTMFQTLGQIAASGDLLVGSGPNALNRLARGAANQILQTVGTGLQWVSFGIGQSQTVGSANADGTQTTPAHSDHVHSGVTTFNGRNGAVAPTTGDYAVAAVTGAAPLADPTFTGVPAGPTAASGTNTTQLATTAFVAAQAALTLGYAQVTANVTGIGGGAATLVTAPAVTVAAGRRVKITANLFNMVAALPAQYQLNIQESTTVLGAMLFGGGNGAIAQAVITPSAGAHTYLVTCQNISGTSGGTAVASATQPCFILVEDIGV